MRVYEREPGGPLQIQWYDADGRHRETLKNAAGAPVYDRELAMKIAKRAALAQAEARERKSAGVLLGLGEKRTLSDLTGALHEALEPEWSAAHKRAQKRMRDFWTRALGKDAPLPFPPARIEEVAKRAARAHSWSPRTHQAYLRYIVDAVYYAQKKLKWVGEHDNLSAVSFPRVQSESKPYTVPEIEAMLKAAPEVDLRIAVMLALAYYTIRRAGALRTLRIEAYGVREVNGRQRGVLSFPGATDKARRSGEAVVPDSVRPLIETLLKDPSVKASGYLFPGERRRKGAHLRPLTEKTINSLLRKVEKAAGVAYIPGRGLHGVKRRAASDARRTGNVRGASKQSGTSERTLERIYDQDELEDKADLVDEMERRRKS